MTVLRIPIRPKKEPDRIFFIASNFKREKELRHPAAALFFLPVCPERSSRPSNHKEPGNKDRTTPRTSAPRHKGSKATRHPDTKAARRTDNLTPREPGTRQLGVPTPQQQGLLQLSVPTALRPDNSARRHTDSKAPSARRSTPARRLTRPAPKPVRFGPFRAVSAPQTGDRPADGQRGYSSSSSP